MKLDRNINPDRCGKYALIQQRKATFDERSQIRQYAGTPTSIILSGECIHTGAEGPGENFFVLKYKDRFAAAALYAYQQAVIEYAGKLPDGEERKALYEYADEILNEASEAEIQGRQTPT